MYVVRLPFKNVVLFSIRLAVVFSGGIYVQQKPLLLFRTRSRPAFFPTLCDRINSIVVVVVVSVMFLVVTLAVVVVVFKEEVLEAAVRRKRHRRDAQTWEAALEPIPPAEEACVSPFLTVWGSLLLAHCCPRGPQSVALLLHLLDDVVPPETKEQNGGWLN